MLTEHATSTTLRARAIAAFEAGVVTPDPAEPVITDSRRLRTLERLRWELVTRSVPPEWRPFNAVVRIFVPSVEGARPFLYLVHLSEA